MKKVFVNGEPVDPAAVIDQRRVMEASYRERLGDTLTPDELEARLDEDALQNAIDRMVLSQAADASRLPVSEKEVNRRLKQLKEDAGGAEAFYRSTQLTPADDPDLRAELRRQVRLEKYFELLGREAPAPDDAACRRVYEENPDRFRVPEMVLASHILRRHGGSAAVMFADMLNIRQALLDGADFAAVAREVSDDPERGGNLGYFPRGKMAPAFEKVVFALEPGEISEVFQTEYGYHIATVFDRRPERIRRFEEVHELIHEELWEQEKNLRIGARADALRETAEIHEMDAP